ncbi:MAG: MmcQ/YjbR family DNA-binding protein [Oscillospiraceae bacterium]|nr:MmcQ/YjbR family DNA-binding protein [Oscillospiraceae bacterium]
MTDNTLFKRRKPNTQKLFAFGFSLIEDRYLFRTDIVDGQFTMAVAVMPDGSVDTQVTDNASDEEYILHRVPGVSGSFVGTVREACEKMLAEISDKCFDPEIFKSAQAKQLIEYVRSAYGDELEFLWQKFPDNAVWRRKDTQKWYGALLTVPKRKLGFDSDETAEIIDLRIKPEELETTLDGKQYLPGYHMNKKNWYTVLLNGFVPIDELSRRIDESYRLAAIPVKEKVATQ